MDIIRRLIVHFFVFILLAQIAWAAEPTYEGRSLSAWIRDLRGLDQSARVRATIAIGKMGEAAAEAVPALAYSLLDPNVKVRANAAWALAQMGDAAVPAIHDLTYALYDSSEHVRGRATVALGGLGRKAQTAAVPIRDGLTVDHPGIRAASAAALWLVTGRSGESVPVLRDMLASGDGEDRIQAAHASARIGKPAAVLMRDLEKAMTNSTPAVRTAVATALGAVGQGNAAARKILEDALDSETDDAVRGAIEGSIKAVGGKRDDPPAGTPSRQGEPPSRKGPRDGNVPPEVGGVRVGPGTGDRDTGNGGRILPPDIRTEPPAGGGSSIDPNSVKGGEAVAAGLMDFGRPKPRVTDASPPPPAEPTHDGKTLTQWMAQLDSKEVGERREAAIALGKLGQNGRCAIGPLNRLRLYDKHENVRLQAALALCRILGVAVGDILPKPPGGSGGAGGAPPIKGQMYYIEAQSITPKGPVMRTDIQEGGNSHRCLLFGYANLRYAELSELQKYYQDAQSRGLDINRPLETLLYDDSSLDRPKGTIGIDPRMDLKRRICKEYKKDHVIRITCNQQTLYEYRRCGPNGSSIIGGCDHYAMTAGKYDAEITIWTEEGFRLDYTVPITVVLNFKKEEDEIISGPEDVAKEERRKLAEFKANPAVDLNNSFFRSAWAGMLSSLTQAYLASCPDGRTQPLRPAELLEYYREGFDLVKQLHGLYPRGYNPMEDHLISLVRNCSSTGSPACLALAQEVTAYLDQHVSSIQDTEQRRRAYWYREVCYRHLADLTITASMDIGACRSLTWKSHLYDNQMIPPGGGKSDKMQLSWYMDNAPQEGWWSSSMDEHRPANFSEIAGVYYGTGGDGNKGKQTEKDGATSGTIEISAETMKLLQEAVERLDETRAEEASFVVKNRESLGHANALVRDALAKLIMLRRAMLTTDKTIKYYEMLLKDETLAMADESWSTEKLSLALQRDARMNEDLAGPTKGGAEGMKAFWQRCVDDLVRKRTQLEKERDEIIDSSLLEYQNVIQSLESRGDNYAEESTKKNAREILSAARQNQARVKAFLLSATDREQDFRDAARAVIEAGGGDEYDMRMLESSLMRQKGNISVALRAAHTALKLKNEDVRGGRRRIPAQKN